MPAPRKPFTCSRNHLILKTETNKKKIIWELVFIIQMLGIYHTHNIYNTRC